MESKEEILQLRKTYLESEKRIEDIGKKQYAAVIKFSEWLGNLIENIESAQERGKELENAAVSPRIKLMKKSVRLSKELKNFEAEVVKAFEEGIISEDTGKRFAAVTNAIKKGNISLAKDEFGYFEEIMESDRTYENAREEFEKKGKALIREKTKAEALLEEIRDLKKETVSLDKVKKYENFLNNIENLENFRKKYLSALASEPVLKLFEDMEKHSLEEYSFPPLGKDELGKIRAFISGNSKLKDYNADQICELFSSSDKKLMHICPVSEFKYIILANKSWFETVRDLDRTDFLAVDDRDKKTMKFYSRKVGGADSSVEQVMRMQGKKNTCKKEYEKNRRIEERKKELSKYSEQGLEKEIKEIEHLLELLHSRHGDKKEEVGEMTSKKSSLLSKIRSFFK